MFIISGRSGEHAGLKRFLLPKGRVENKKNQRGVGRCVVGGVETLEARLVGADCHELKFICLLTFAYCSSFCY